MDKNAHELPPPNIARNSVLAISFIENMQFSRALTCAGLSEKVCFMAVTDTAVNNFLDKEAH